MCELVKSSAAFVICLSYFAVLVSSDDNGFDPDTFLPTNKIIQRHGYPAESHEVTTDDGYILTLHRIPHGKKGDRRSNVKRHPVFFQHGVLGSSCDWIVSGPEKSLPYLLADKGHDVWLGNARGNTYSRGHTKLSPDHTEFWNFTFHDMGTHDLVAEIDYILGTTGNSKLHYIGHSMGTTMFYVLCSTKPEYNKKIVNMFSLAPVAFMANARTPIRYFAPFAKDIQLLSNWFGEGEFLPQNAFIKFTLKHLCEMTVFEAKLCENNLFIICGHDPQQFNSSLGPIIFGHTPAGTSTKTLAHYAQEIQSGLFRQFDYGPNGNEKAYNQDWPPNYDLSLITAPISLYFADNDLLANPKDVKKLAESLPNVIGLHRINFHMFNHLDFLWAKDVNRYVNDFVIATIDNLEQNGVISTSDNLIEEVFEKREIEEIATEPPFNDVSAMLHYRARAFGEGYLNKALKFKLTAEQKIISLKDKTERTFRRHMKTLQNLFNIEENKVDESD